MPVSGKSRAREAECSRSDRAEFSEPVSDYTDCRYLSAVVTSLAVRVLSPRLLNRSQLRRWPAPSFRISRSAAGALPCVGSLCAATRRDGATIRDGGGSHPSGPAAGGSRSVPRAHVQQYILEIGPRFQAMTLRSRQDREQHRRSRASVCTPQELLSFCVNAKLGINARSGYSQEDKEAQRPPF